MFTLFLLFSFIFSLNLSSSGYVLSESDSVLYHELLTSSEDLKTELTEDELVLYHSPIPPVDFRLYSSIILVPTADSFYIL